jgi:hypothetical protein
MYRIRAQALDTSGKASEIAQISVSVQNAVTDDIPPEVAVTYPSDGATVSDTVTIQGTAFDNEALDRVVVKITSPANGVSIEAQASGTENWSYAWDTTSGANGSYTVSATAYDQTGNADDMTINVDVDNITDNEAPSVAITAPGNGDTVSGAVAISGTASDDNQVEQVQIIITDQSGSRVAGGTASGTQSWSYTWNTVNAANGHYNIQAIAVDNFGKESDGFNTAVVVENSTGDDTESPNLTISSPANNATVSGTVTIGGTASDNVGIEQIRLMISGSDTSARKTVYPDISGTSWSYDWNTEEESNGRCIIYAYAYDAVGNYKTSYVFVNVDNDNNNSSDDTQAPVISIDQPDYRETVAGAVLISGTADDNQELDRVELRIRSPLTGTDMTVTATGTTSWSYTWDTTSVENGSYYFIMATAYDAAGNKSNRTIYVNVQNTYNNAAPSVDITYPAHNSTVGGLLDIEGTASDDIQVDRVEVEIRDAANLVQGGLAQGTDTWSYAFDTNTVKNGDYTIIVKAVDDAGQLSNEKSITVSIENDSQADTAAPQVTVTNPLSNDTVSGTITLAGTAQDDTQLYFVLLRVYDSNSRLTTFKIFTCSTDYLEWSHSFNTTSLENGEYHLMVRATDKSGFHSEAVTVDFTVDNSL